MVNAYWLITSGIEQCSNYNKCKRMNWYAFPYIRIAETHKPTFVRNSVKIHISIADKSLFNLNATNKQLRAIVQSDGRY